MSQVLIVRVDIGVVAYEAMASQCLRLVVQILVVRVDIGEVTYEAMTPQSGRSVVQVLVVREDIEVVINESMRCKFMDLNLCTQFRTSKHPKKINKQQLLLN